MDLKAHNITEEHKPRWTLRHKKMCELIILASAEQHLIRLAGNPGAFPR